MKLQKQKSFYKEIFELTIHHFNKSKIYRKILNNFNFNKNKKYSIERLPFIPVRFFKHIDLKSIEDKDVFKILKSSGTSGQQSKIFLNTQNAIKQRIVLKELFERYVNKERLPMFILGQNPKNNGYSYDAKTAAILGFSMFGKNHQYFIDENNEENIESFLSQIKLKNKVLMFGFTSEVYSFFSKTLKNYKKKIDLSNVTLLHGGGWKKLEETKISNYEFKKNLRTNFNIKKIINYYGLVEQIGSIFFECPKCNLFICSKYSDIIIRDKDFNVLTNKKGMVQLLSLLPTSYPGHNILTEDIGEVVSNVNCEKKHKEKMFRIFGRIEKSEIRGCSNV